MSRITFRMTAGTNVGCVRTNNEDNFIINENLSQSDWFLPQDTSKVITLGQDGCVLVVADGMGGLNAGEVASAIAVETVKQSFLDADLRKVSKTPKAIEKFMRDIVKKSDQTIKKHVKAHPETQGMGTTLIFVWIHGTTAHLVWCGDSRAYIYNKENGLVRFSKDHSYVQQLVDEGKLDEELAFDHPESNIITRCLGDFQDRAKPDYKSVELGIGDILLICSDGLCGLCRDEEILHIMQQSSSDIELCKQTLIQSALDAGGYDNVTLALFETVGMEEAEAKVDKEFSLKRFVRHQNRETKEINDVMLFDDEETPADGVASHVDEVQQSEAVETLCAENKDAIDEVTLAEDAVDDVSEGQTSTEEVVEEISFADEIKDGKKRKTIILILALILLVAIALVAMGYIFQVDVMSFVEATVKMSFGKK